MLLSTFLIYLFTVDNLAENEKKPSMRKNFPCRITQTFRKYEKFQPVAQGRTNVINKRLVAGSLSLLPSLIHTHHSVFNNSTENSNERVIFIKIM